MSFQPRRNNSSRTQRGGSRPFNPRFSRGGRNRNRRRRSKGANIDISLFVNKAQPDNTPEYQATRLFSDMNIEERLKHSIDKKGYSTPTQIQEQTIEKIVEGKDLLGVANTGTGKTGAFLIPIINKIIQDRSQKALIIAPTRELALQIDKEFQSLAAILGVKSVLCMGGTSMYVQRRNLQKRFNVIIGTPGRLIDITDQRILNLSDFSTIVLDEVDRMLDMGFVDPVRQILKQLSPKRQSLFFSATTNPQILKLITEFSTDLETVSVKQKETASTIEQDIVRFKGAEDKIETLHKLLIQKDVDKVLIFRRTKRSVNNLHTELRNRGFRADSIHGNKSQPQRQRALNSFRQNYVKILIATDVAARGLDINNVTHVINYDLPESYEDYVHRIGRTGRANKKGKALTFVS